MSSDDALQPLKRTRESLDQISDCLKPFLSILDRYNKSSRMDSNERSKNTWNTDSFDARNVAEAKMAVALSIGTLRYMASKLGGEKVEKNDPLRLELDKMRKILVELNSLHEKDDADHPNSDEK